MYINIRLTYKCLSVGSRDLLKGIKEKKKNDNGRDSESGRGKVVFRWRGWWKVEDEFNLLPDVVLR